MLACTYVAENDFRLLQKPVPELEEDTDAIVRVTLSSICTSDLHIMHGSVRARSKASRSDTKRWAKSCARERRSPK